MKTRRQMGFGLLAGFLVFGTGFGVAQTLQDPLTDVASSASLPATQDVERTSVEDLFATGKIDTSISDIDMDAPDWVNQAAEAVGAVEGSTYVKLDQGVLTVDQLNALLRSMPFEVRFADSNNQFLYMNPQIKNQPNETDMDLVGQPIGKTHPDFIHDWVAGIVYSLRQDEEDAVRIVEPQLEENDFILHNYQRMESDQRDYMGIHESVIDLLPLIDWYLEETKQELVPSDQAEDSEPTTDTQSQATSKE